MSENTELAPSAKEVFQDVITTLTLLGGGYAIEAAKSFLFGNQLPVILLGIINVSELTLAIGFLIALIRMIKSLVTAIKELGSVLPLAIFRIMLDSLGELVKKGIINGMHIGLVTGGIFGVFLVIIFLMALIGSAPSWLYWTLLVLAISAPVIGLYLVYQYDQEQSKPNVVQSGQGFAYIVIFIFLAFITIPSIFIIAAGAIGTDHLNQLMSLIFQANRLLIFSAVEASLIRLSGRYEIT